MTPGAGATPPYSYAVAGLRVKSADRLLGLDVDGWTDGEVSVRFREEPREATAGATDGWLALPQQCGCRGAVAEDGRTLLLADPGRGPAGRGAVAGQAVPFAAILQGRLTLHAAAVTCHDGAAAFTGASGSGKSTLAAALGRIGVPVLADDLLPCRVSAAGHAVPVRVARGAWSLEPLSRIYFLLPRAPDVPVVACAPMRRGAAVLELVRNGFGELPVGSVWRRQLDLYVALAEQVRAFTLRLPEGLDRVASAAAEVAALLGPGSAP